MRRLLSIMMLFIMIFSGNKAFAEVYTYNGSTPRENSIFVIGNPDLYPIEYYNASKGEFEGVLPDILREISKRCKVDFTYLLATSENKTALIEHFGAEMVNTYMTELNAQYLSEYVTLLSYEADGVTYNVGWRFTEFADENLISMMKAEAEEITVEETTALFIKHSHNSPKSKIWNILIPIIFAALLGIVISLFATVIIKIKKRAKIKEMTDSATGIGNLAYFEKRFGYFVGENNYIVYIIADSNQLQLYHSESTFRDAIKYIADTLTYYAAENEIVARITENGFAYVFESESEKSAKNHIEEIIGQLSVYLEKDGNSEEKYFRSVAYRMKPQAQNYDLLLFNLRRNCAKLMETDTVFMFCTEEILYSEIEEKEFLEDIERGFKDKEFKLYLQFVFNNKTREIVSAEALSRWQRGEELIYPGKYIPGMEKSGDITRFDYYMFEAVCIQLHKWRQTEFDNISISCNFTRITLSEKDFIERIEEISNRYVFDKKKLIIEMTEDAIETSHVLATNNILKCKALGFGIALDDMGSGYTSLSNLCDYPIDILKIDRSILTKIDNPNGKDLINGIIALSHSIGVKVVCEGIETDKQMNFIEETECDYVQGFNYFKPDSVKNAEKFYKNYKKVNGEE